MFHCYKCINTRQCGSLSISQTMRLLRWSRLVQPRFLRLNPQRPFSARTNVKSKTRGERTAEHVYTMDVMPWRTQSELLDHLCANIFYQDRNIVAFNKPYGLAAVPLKVKEDAPMLYPDMIAAEDRGFSIKGLLPELAHRLEVKSLDPVFRTPRLFSGICILSKKKEVTERLSQYFNKSLKAKKRIHTYWMITNGIPQDLPGEVEAFGVGRVNVGDYRMFERKPVTETQIRKRLVKRTDIHAQVLDKNTELDVALVEITTDLAIWDNLQVYMLMHLAPVLGDHYYSSRLKSFMGNKLIRQNVAQCMPEPQVLSAAAQERLDVEHLKKLRVPLHLHCGEIIIPNFDETKNNKRKPPLLTLRVPPPGLFDYSLKALGLGRKLEHKFKNFDVEESMNSGYVQGVLKENKVHDKEVKETHTRRALDNYVRQHPGAEVPEEYLHKQDSETFLYYSKHSPFSTSYPARFTAEDGRTYANATQYIMYKKAALFGDEAMCLKVLQTTDQREMATFEVVNYDHEKWETNVAKILREAAFYKFSQNEDLKRRLLETGDLYIGNSTNMKFWGTGVKFHKKDALDQKTWTGWNITGEALMYVRDKLRKQS